MMITKKIIEERVTDSVTRIHSSRFYFQSFNRLDILRFHYIKERAIQAQNLEIMKIAYSNLQNIKKSYFEAYIQSQEILKKSLDSRKLSKLCQDLPDIFSLAVETGHISESAIADLRRYWKAEEYSQFLKYALKTFSRSLKTIRKDIKDTKDKKHSIYIWDIQEAQKGRITESANRVIYSYIAQSKARKGSDSQAKKLYYQEHPFIEAHFLNPQPVHYLASILIDRIERSFLYQAQPFLYVPDTVKHEPLERLFQFIHDMSKTLQE